MKKQIHQFTILELLIVISVITILCALLLPALNSVRKKAESIQCVSNLKQSGTYMMMYCNAFDDWIPPPTAHRDNGLYTGGNFDDFDSLMTWARRLIMFVEGKEKTELWGNLRAYETYSCPSYPRVNCTTTEFVGYAATYGLSNWLGGAWNTNVFVRLSSIGKKATDWVPAKSPGNTMLLADTVFTNGKRQSCYWGTAQNAVSARHSLQANAMMLDNSVRSLGIAALRTACNGKDSKIYDMNCNEL